MIVGKERYWQNWDYGEAAKRIDEYWQNSEQGWRRVLFEHLSTEFSPGDQILEIGCGSGMIYGELERAGLVTPRTYIGGDVSKKMLDIARRRYPGVSFIELDVLGMELGDDSQANVLCVHLLQHLPYYDRAVQELLRLARDKLCIVSWFTADENDEVIFSEPSDRWDGQRFQNNRYSLGRFLHYLRSTTSELIEDVRVHQFDTSNYAITIDLGQRV